MAVAPQGRGKASLARDLRRIRNQYGSEVEAEKRRLLRRLAADPPQTAHALRHFHEDLLFLSAFPGERMTLRLARRLRDRIESWVKKLPRDERQRLHDSGVAGSVTRHVFPLPLAQWLVRRAPGEADIDWRHYADPTLLDGALFSVLRPVEREAAESGALSTRALFKAVRGAAARSDLDWIIGALSPPSVDRAQADALWTAADTPLAWSLEGSRWSTTKNALPGSPVVMRRAMRRPQGDAGARILEPMTVERLPRPRALKVIECAQAALGARCREVVAISYPNADEVYWCDLGEGAALAVIGISMDDRLNLETNTGYLLLSNGVPIGYGGVTPFFRQANTGINIFDPFRGGEAAFLWVEMLRAFHSIYGVTRFVVNGYQFGEGNSEAIRSGAYWFYYRLGFRPDAAAQRKLAAKEAARLMRKDAPPSEARVLRSLAKGDLVLETPGFDGADALDEKLLFRASLAAGRRLAGAVGHARAAAEKSLVEEVATALGVSSLKEWTRAERAGFARLAPIALLIRGVETWPAAEKAQIIALMRAKGARAERDFARACAGAPRFFRALAASLKETPA